MHTVYWTFTLTSAFVQQQTKSPPSGPEESFATTRSVYSPGSGKVAVVPPLPLKTFLIGMWLPGVGSTLGCAFSKVTSAGPRYFCQVSVTVGPPWKIWIVSASKPAAADRGQELGRGDGVFSAGFGGGGFDSGRDGAAVRFQRDFQHHPHGSDADAAGIVGGENVQVDRLAGFSRAFDDQRLWALNGGAFSEKLMVGGVLPMPTRTWD